ncbi:MAG: hypothetical protein AUH36_04420 [Chloroflexi bacterium 13_1_40CM_55_7]|nr:MAG: hypothetical protein AUH36_04420 [Chloroflexi bacterium 13_1_40CM_55_7]
MTDANSNRSKWIDGEFAHREYHSGTTLHSYSSSIIAIANGARSASLPNVPTPEESGRRSKSPKSSRTFGFVPDPMTPAALASLIDSDIAAYAAMVKRTRISAD